MKWAAGCVCGLALLGALLWVGLNPAFVNGINAVDGLPLHGRPEERIAVAEAETLYPATVMGAGVLPLWDAPETDGECLGYYYPGVQVWVLEECGPAWVRVRVGEAKGYMAADRLAILDAAWDVPCQMPTLVLQSNASSRHVQLRQEPSDKAMSLGRYPDGTKVTVMGIAGDWRHVEVNGRIGYMMAVLLAEMP